jgi:hypothetical protein
MKSGGVSRLPPALQGTIRRRIVLVVVLVVVLGLSTEVEVEIEFEFEFEFEFRNPKRSKTFDT